MTSEISDNYLNRMEGVILPYLDSRDDINNWFHFSAVADDFLSKRIYNWFGFFNRVFEENKLRNYKLEKELLLQYSLNALISLSEDDILVNQTSFEFRLSKKFYELILSSDNLLYFQDIEQAKYFLKMSLVFSTYYGFVNESLLKNSELLYPHCTIEQQSLFFRNVFSRYKNVCSSMLFRNLHNMNGRDLKIFMQLLSGKSLRKNRNFMLRYSKKQASLFLHEFPNTFQFEGQIFFYGWFFSKLFMVYPNRKYFNRFIGASRIIDQNLEFFIQNYEFFESLYRWLSVNKEKLDLQNSFGNRYITEREIIDYFMFLKRVDERVISFKGRTVRSVCNQVERWHDNQFENQYRISYDDIQATWGDEETDIWKDELDGLTYKIEEIKDGKTLLEESEMHHHCVFSYVKYCKDGSSRIFRMSKGVINNLQPCLTIEVKERLIIQVAGKFNRKVNNKEKEVLKKWGASQNFLMENYSRF